MEEQTFTQTFYTKSTPSGNPRRMTVTYAVAFPYPLPVRIDFDYATSKDRGNLTPPIYMATVRDYQALQRYLIESMGDRGVISG